MNGYVNALNFLFIFRVVEFMSFLFIPLSRYSKFKLLNDIERIHAQSLKIYAVFWQGLRRVKMTTHCPFLIRVKDTVYKIRHWPFILF